jgi:hypothetical protein
MEYNPSSSGWDDGKPSDELYLRIKKGDFIFVIPDRLKQSRSV